jgi:hypothetical protein
MGRNNDIFRQIEELTFENEKLRKENTRLRTERRAENIRLHERIETLERSMEERIAKAVSEAIANATAPLYAKIESQEQEIARLKSQLNKDSSNSSKPPSSNGFRKIPNNRDRSDKKQGGQHGHKGNRLNIPENLDELVAAGKAEHVIISDVAEGEAYGSDWTIDLKIIPVFMEQRRAVGTPPKIEYGAQLKVIAVYLCIVGLISVKRLSEFFREISHGLITVSKGALAGFNHEVADSLYLEEQVHD